MSRAPTTYTVPPPPAGLVLNPVPTIKGKAAAAQWICDKLGIAVTERYITNATNRREIEFAKIMGACWYSESGLYRFVMSKTVPAQNGAAS